MDAENLIRFSPLNVLPRNQRLLSGLVCGLDLCVILGLLWMMTFAFGPASSDELMALSALLMLIVPTIFQSVGRYTFQPANPPKLDYSRIWLGWGVVIAALLFLEYMSHTAYLSSLGTHLWLFLTPLGLSLLNPIIRGPLQQRVSGDYNRTAIIAGTGEMGQQVADQLCQSTKSGIKFCGYFADKGTKLEAESCRPMIGYLDELPDFVRRSRIDVVYITLPLSEEAAISDLILALQDTTACVYFVPNLMMLNLMQARVHDLNGLPMIAVMEVPFSKVQAWIKRCIDFAIAALISTAISPLMILIAIAIKLSSPGPVLFKQQRYGLNGGNIVVYKFRSMRVMEDGAKVTQATQGDPRITKVGAFLRRTSLDELPQFINVLQGRMSLVGPRPHAVAHNEHYRKLIQGYMLRHKVKPGITGWAQVNGYRGETETLDKMEKRVEYDIHYLNHWSLWLDIKIILRTALVFFNHQNAY
ncbi:undecaprenyl-phosphate glucose phosphotransferase [Acaryochloris sp. CCMEE 5410]|uniref:undecaprenyl-phosphate glucose phosphotransferase n=1 Tax=Acaryochloris sp. CCMEE 5410 TaxID=310037 RepID=UPI0002485270|nr:undecaprenyl-phosphate glucose phosphotransferase [Acaryochloris sp. CCMEE 5410]KAI9132935.1 undecaprenyl-phosphate glucose phosphotransferase [Acaryochloris sp. CCMEE 5410]